MDPLPPFKGFIDHELNAASCLHKGLHQQIKQAMTHLRWRPTSPIADYRFSKDSVKPVNKMSIFCQVGLVKAD